MNNNDSRLIRLLLKQTLDGKAAWDDTISSDTYQADLENAIVQSFSYEGNWDSMHYGIRILRKTDTRKMDIVVLSVRSLKAGAGEAGLEPAQMFAESETVVFSQVVTLAEKAGKHVELMVVPGTDPYDAVVQTAARLQSSRIVMGLSPKLTPAEQGAQVGAYWEKLPEPRPSISLELVLENQKDVVFFNLGPHPPRLWPEDIDLVHKLWLDVKAKGPGAKLHHRDIVGVALRRMAKELDSERITEVMNDIEAEVSSSEEP